MVMIKGVNEELDYVFNWETWLKNNNPEDTIASSTLVVPDGITQLSVAETTLKTTIWLGGGTLYRRYKIKNQIVTAQNRKAERSFTIFITDR